MHELQVSGLLLASMLRIAVPYVFAAVGGYFSERSGVINIALEGMLLVGAFACVVAAHAAETAGVPGALAGWMLADGLPARLQVQLHKYLWPGVERGV